MRRFDYFIAGCKKRGSIYSRLTDYRQANASIIGGSNRKMSTSEYRVLSYLRPSTAGSAELLQETVLLLSTAIPELR